VSDRQHALRTPDANNRNRDASHSPTRLVQRKCGCGGTCGACSDEEKKKKVQRRALGETSPAIPSSVESILGSPGRTLDTDTRATMESRFGRSFAEVRVHTDSHAAASAREIDAAAYTSGTHIVFGTGRLEPRTAKGRRLLAHELAHVIQQRSGTALPSGIGPADDAHERAADRVADAVTAQGPVFAPPPAIVPVAERLVRRKREDDVPATVAAEPARFIVEDNETPAAGQMRRGAFVDELDAAVCATSSQEMGQIGRSTDGCPMLEQWRPRLRAMGARELEVSLRRWIEGDAVVRTARDYIPRVAHRLAQSIRAWGSTGQILGIPPDLMSLMGGGRIRVGVGSLISGAVGRLFRKARDGAPAPAGMAPVALAEGRPLDANVASHMGLAFGRDFSGVRIHTGAAAAASASRMNARAFTIGGDIAFAGGEYAPGTLIGDALLAHELAHVAQQRDSRPGAEDAPMAKNSGGEGALERDADDAAVHAVAALWPNVRRFSRGLRASAMPRLKSSLQLQRCSPKPAEMQAYMGSLDRTGTIAKDDSAAAKKARKLAEEWSKGDVQYVLTVRRKILLIQQLLADGPSGDDEEQILNILERTESPDLKLILGRDGAIPHASLLDRFDDNREALWRFYMRRYSDAYPDDVKKLIEDNFYGWEAPKPQAPDRKKLGDAEPGTWPPFSLVQFGDKRPEVTKPSDVQTGRSTKKPAKSDARDWVLQVYGKVISKGQTARVNAASVSPDPGNDTQFTAFVEACMSSRPEKDRKRARDICDAQEPGVQAMYDRDSNTISVHMNREMPETMLHETLHAFSDEAVRRLGHHANEGMTEYFTRHVAQRRSLKKGEQRIYLGGSYAREYDIIQELAILVGEDLLTRVYFQGHIKELCDALGKARFDAWNEKMDNPFTLEEALPILRGKTPVPETKEKCE